VPHSFRRGRAITEGKGKKKEGAYLASNRYIIKKWKLRWNEEQRTIFFLMFFSFSIENKL
jgi:hypothetical protein